MNRSILLVAAVVLAAGTLDAGVIIEHKPVGCVVAEKHPRLEAHLEPAAEVARAHVYFRAAGTPHWYSVEMTRQAESWSGILPKPRKSSGRIEYYLEATDRAVAATRTAERVAEVVAGPDACRKELPLAATVSSARVAVTAAVGAPAVPAGFLESGLLVAGGGVSTGVILGIAGGAAVVGGAVVVASGRDEDGGPPEPPTVAGSWIGTGADGLLRDHVDTANAAFTCRREDDLFLELQQAGEAITGEARLVSRVNTCSSEPAGTVRVHGVTGSLVGTTVRLTGLPLPTGSSTHTWTGTLSGAHMGGTAVSVGGTLMGRGTWSVRRR